jgi:toxin ParE1/3/4
VANYRLNNEAKNDLIRIHQYGVKRFGEQQADKYFNTFFECFEMIADRPFSYESVDHIKEGYRRCVCGADSIFFRVNDKVVEIMAIIGRQDITGIIK